MKLTRKIGLGGHTFIQELGNDPGASFEEQCAIVSACLDHGINLIDTTYYQERVALGKILQKIKRRDEAVIMAWNFFKQPGKEQDLVPPSLFEAHNIDIMLNELQADYLDILVIHIDEDRDNMRKMLELAAEWIAVGKIKQAALGMLKLEHLQQLPAGHPISYVLAPLNVFNQEALEVFKLAKANDLQVIALSPFVRGWKLDEIQEDKAIVSDVFLRWVTNNELVDAVIISMRKSEWVKANLDSVDHGELSENELNKLEVWMG